MSATWDLHGVPVVGASWLPPGHMLLVDQRPLMRDWRPAENTHPARRVVRDAVRAAFTDADRWLPAPVPDDRLWRSNLQQVMWEQRFAHSILRPADMVRLTGV